MRIQFRQPRHQERCPMCSTVCRAMHSPWLKLVPSITSLRNTRISKRSMLPVRGLAWFSSLQLSKKVLMDIRGIPLVVPSSITKAFWQNAVSIPRICLTHMTSISLQLIPLHKIARGSTASMPTCRISVVSMPMPVSNLMMTTPSGSSITRRVSSYSRSTPICIKMVR